MIEKTKSSYSSSHLQRNSRLQKTQNAETTKTQKERKKERRRERRRRRRRNGDASSRSDCISSWLRSFNNGGKYPKKKKKIRLGWTSKNRSGFQDHDIWVFGLCVAVMVGWILGCVYHGGCWCFGGEWVFVGCNRWVCGLLMVALRSVVVLFCVDVVVVGVSTVVAVTIGC